MKTRKYTIEAAVKRKLPVHLANPGKNFICPVGTVKFYQSGCLEMGTWAGEARLIAEGEALLQPVDVDEDTLRALPAGTELIFGRTSGCSLTKQVRGKLVATPEGIKLNDGKHDLSVSLSTVSSAYVVLVQA